MNTNIYNDKDHEGFLKLNKGDALFKRFYLTISARTRLDIAKTNEAFQRVGMVKIYEYLN